MRLRGCVSRVLGRTQLEGPQERFHGKVLETKRVQRAAVGKQQQRRIPLKDEAQERVPLISDVVFGFTASSKCDESDSD